MRVLRLAAAITVAVLGAGPALAAEIRFAPGAAVNLNPIGRGRYDLVLHSLAIAPRPGETFTLQGVTLELSQAGRPVLTRHLEAAAAVADTRALAGLPVSAMREAQALDAKGFRGRFAEGPVIRPGEVLVATARHFSIDEPVDALTATVRGTDATGAPVAFTATVPVRQHRSVIEYRMPLDGAWLMNGVPTPQSHHRMTPPTEYAVDFFRLDGEGRIYAGDSSKAENAYGYGAPVRAAAAGVVVAAWDDVVQDRAAMRPLAGETPQAAGARIEAAMLARMRSDMLRATAGNLVVIRHGEGAGAEYSAYGHLKTGSLRVRPGRTVAQGEVIALVGDTGDTPTPHLHFQLNAGPDPLRSASLPVRFVDARVLSGNDDLGRHVAKQAPRTN